MKIADRIALFAVAFCALSVVAHILWLRPFYGLMDDHRNVYELFPEILRDGLWARTRTWLEEDLRWGMFRVWYPALIIYVFYGIGQVAGVTAFYLANAAVSFAAYAGLAWVLAKRMQVGFWRVMLAIAAFFYAYDLYFHPSMQEKLLHLFGAPLIWLASRSSPRLALRTGLLMLITALGLGVKSSFFIHITVAWFAFVISLRNETRARAASALAVLTIADLALFLSTAYVSRMGGYTTSGYSLAKVMPNLLTNAGVLHLAAVILGLAAALDAGRKTGNWYTVLAPLGVLAYLALFLPWGIGGYLQTGMAPFFAATLVLVLRGRIPESRALAWIVPLAILAMGFGTYRPFASFLRLHEVGEIASRAADWRAAGVRTIQMPCHEGAVAMGRYFRHVGGVADFQVQEATVPTPRTGNVVLFDNALCPLPGRAHAIAGCTMEYLFQSTFKKGFMLVRLACEYE